MSQAKMPKSTIEPKSIEELKKMLWRYHVSDSDLEKFQDEIDEEDYDLDGIKEDVNDPEQSMLIDFCRDTLEGKERVFEIMKAILEGRQYTDKITESKPLLTTPEPAAKIQKKQVKEEEKDKKEIKHITVQHIGAKKHTNEHKQEEEWQYNKSAEHPDGTVILNAGLIIIPDVVICDERYLESIDGITYVMKYNNCVIKEPARARFPYSYIEFWKTYLEDEPPTFGSIQSDIQKNEGPTYDYLMENPPFDRILPVLEKIIDQLSHVMLNSNPVNEKRAHKKAYENAIKKFYEQQTPDFKASDAVIKACIMFKKNTNENNFNTFELFINFVDIYDRILYQNPELEAMDITGARAEGKIWINKAQQEAINEHHFTAKLLEDDFKALHQSLSDIKEASFFASLKGNNTLISDDLEAFQFISLSFLLFIKAFMCQTGNFLEAGSHFHNKRNKKKKMAQKEAPAIIDSLKTYKYKRAEAKAKQDGSKPKYENIDDVQINDDDILFHNENMPLQFDLVLIPNDDNCKIQHTLNEEHKEFAVERCAFETPKDIKSVYELYGAIVKTFRKCLSNAKNKEIDIKEDETQKRSKAKKRRRDDRYCIVFDRRKNMFYIYPPHIKNGDKKIVHFKGPPAKKSSDKKANKEEEGTEAAEKEDKNVETKDDKAIFEADQEVENKFSFIAHEYNDLTNFYLTHKCLIPSISAPNKEYYGLDDLPFVLSAHYHKQRQWHRHPKLRLYQYFNGCGLRFFYKESDENIHNLYKWDQDIVELWPKYFKNTKSKIDKRFIKECQVFDAVFDLYKCDMQYFRWDNAIKRAMNKRGIKRNEL